MSVDEKKAVTTNELLAFAMFHQLPFAAYRLPGNELPQIISALDFNLKRMNPGDNFSDEKGFIIRAGSVNDFFQTVIQPDVFWSGKLLIVAKEKQTAFQKLWKDFKQDSSSSSFEPTCTKELHEATRQEFCEQVNIIQNQISAGKISKAILSRVRLVAKPEKFSVVEIFEKLCKKYSDAFTSLVYLSETGFWMGASPELLVSCEGDEVKTVSLAGTKKTENRRQKTEDVHWTAKESEEQQIVSDYILSCLKKFFDEKINVDGPKTSTAGTLAHLKTVFTVKTENPKEVLSPLVDLLHPTPAISGFPKKEALEVIKKLEQHDRELYAGFLGPVNMNNQTELFVNLRCMKICKDEIALFAGAGITAASIPEREWEETEFKSGTMMDVLSNH